MILDVFDASQVAAARRSASHLAKMGGMDEESVGRVALIATEMGTNLLKHAPGGRILLETFSDASGQGVEIMVVDQGGGIADIGRALADGFSTGGTAGQGLGAIRRQADHFDLVSRPQTGTAVMARVCRKPAFDNVAPLPTAPLIGAVVGNARGEEICGDAWAHADTALGQTLLVVDGSGHGPLAAKAALAAVECFQARAADSCVAIVEAIHRALAPTRGGAVAVARIDTAARLVRFVGVGNIAGAVISGSDVRRMVSHNGTAGQIAPRIREFTYPYEHRPTVLMHSDGLTAKWDLAAYPGLIASHPSLLAGVLYRDHYRSRDDVTVIALRAA